MLITFVDYYFNDEAKLESSVKECDVIMQLDTLNRHSNPNVIYNINIELVNKLTHH